MSKVADLMSKEVVSASTITKVARVEQLLDAHGITAVPVLSDGKLVGVVSKTDLVALGERAASPTLSAGDVMQKPVLTTSADAAWDEAGRRMVAGRVHRLFVTEGDHVTGVLSARDILKKARELRVKEPISTFMTREVITVDLGDSIEAALGAIRAARVHGLVVMDGSRAVGLFTQKEALAANNLPRTLRENPVEEVMSYETIFLDAGTPLSRAAAYATALDVRRLLVTNHHQLAGILSVVDLVDALCRATA